MTKQIDLQSFDLVQLQSDERLWILSTIVEIESCAIQGEVEGFPDVKKGFDEPTGSHFATNGARTTEIDSAQTTSAVGQRGKHKDTGRERGGVVTWRLLEED